MIYTNDAAQFQLLASQNYDLNFKCEHLQTELDDLITPLTAASYLGRLEMVNIMLGCKFIDINLATENSCIDSCE